MAYNVSIMHPLPKHAQVEPWNKAIDVHFYLKSWLLLDRAF